jgi:hypothetical protein
MEHLDDRELNDLLSRWQAPATPARLRARVFAPRRSGRPLWVLPLAVCLFVVLYLKRPQPRPAPRALTFCELQPVRELRPRILPGPHAAN